MRARPRPRIPTPLVLLVATAVLLGACGDADDAGIGPATASTQETTALDATTAETTPETTARTAAQTAVESTTTVAGSTLPGDELEGFARPGDVLAVLGVADDDVLNVRAGPGTDQPIVAAAQPTADDLVATGRARSLPNSIWYEVTIEGTLGWASSRFLAFAGPTDDATGEYVAGDGEPEAETMEQLGTLVADFFAADAPPSTIVQSVAPSVGDLAEITYDVVGLADDSLAGLRLHVFAVPTEDGKTFGLKSIERTTYCSRGVSGELCL